MWKTCCKLFTRRQTFVQSFFSLYKCVNSTGVYVRTPVCVLVMRVRLRCVRMIFFLDYKIEVSVRLEVFCTSVEPMNGLMAE